MRLRICQTLYSGRTEENYIVKPVIEVNYVRYEPDLPDADGMYHKEPRGGMLVIDRDGDIWAIPDVSEEAVERYATSMLTTDMADASNFANAYRIEDYPDPQDFFITDDNSEE